MTINKILNLIKEEALKGVEEVLIKNVWEIDNVAVKYPLGLIDIHARTHTFQPGVTYFSINLYFVDKVKSDGSESINAISDMAEVMYHFIDHMEGKFDEFSIVKKQGSQLPFRTIDDKWNDTVAGVYIEASIEVPTNKKCINRFDG